jgi:phosphoribosylglycinamide formyltransferase-1
MYNEIRLVVFASGNGSNAQRIAEYFSNHPIIRVGLMLTNRPDAYVRTRATQLNIPCEVFGREELNDPLRFPEILKKHRIDAIILAGFLWLIPAYLLLMYPKRILNIHPALLPAYGGKGMYGNSVHQAVIRAGEEESGITIHHVNERYDEGDVIFQARCPVYPDDTPDVLASRIHELEYRYFPVVIEQALIAEFNPR